MKRLLANIATVCLIAASVFAGYALAAPRTIAAIPDSSGFGSNVREHVPYVSPEYVMSNAGATLERVRCSVAAKRTLCYAATR